MTAGSNRERVNDTNSASSGKSSRPTEILDVLDVAELKSRIARIAKESNDERVAVAYGRFAAGEGSLAQLNTCLMDNFRCHRNLESYSLLYELNHRDFLIAIMKRLRFVQGHLDPRDILQDVFFSIFRYPHKFRDEKEFSFRNWSYSIIRNTILKHLRGVSGATVPSDTATEMVEDESETSPLAHLENEENRGECGLRWLLILSQYLKAYDRLSERERLALQLVEVESVRYREASERLSIKLENLKMVICRARKKIFRAIGQVAGGEA